VLLVGAGSFVKTGPVRRGRAARSLVTAPPARGESELTLTQVRKKTAKIKEKERAARVRYPIGIKLVVIITVLITLSLGAITYLVSWLVGMDVRITAEDNNFTVNQRSASIAQRFLDTARSSSSILISALDTGGAAQTVRTFFQQNPFMAALIVERSGYAAADRYAFFVNEAFFAANELDPLLTRSYIRQDEENFAPARQGLTDVQNVTQRFGVPVLALYFPFDGEDGPRAACAFFSPDELADSFGSGSNATCLINGADDVLIHPDEELVSSGASMAMDPFVQEMRARSERQFQTRYTDADGLAHFAAFQKLDTAGAVVITTIPEATVFEGVERTTARNLYLTAAVLSLSIMFIYLFSKTISVPLRRLTRAAGQIEQGNYDLHLRIRGQDEISVLTDSFLKMGKGLSERERLKDTFGRFTNKAIVERAMRGDLALGGETKTATIFFSDIRAFTAISEKLEPDEVVQFLNEYMTRMVACVDKTGGVVDKFIGDAVMAVWGAPVSTGAAAKDALSCVRAALLMRDVLRSFNEGRGGGRKPVIKIGCGINTGSVVAGQIGSTQRMEYTVIGDAVNLASRTEALNKPLGTDILITGNTWELIKGAVITEEMPPVSVKGKEKPVRMFAVVNLRPPAGAPPPYPATLSHVRAMLGIEAPDLSKVDLGAEEKKYKIGG
jgi:adenylate cyclase